jgi:glucosamine-phosphate N-acetyltransferase
MSEIKYTSLIDLINTYPDNIELIKNRYLLLLSELTLTPYIETSLFLKNIEKIHQMGKIIVATINHKSSNNIEFVASGTIIIEPKIIRDGKNVGHIEDIVVSKHMRGKGVSQQILNILKTIARENNCYKVILDCDNAVKNVYIKNGLDIKGIQMSEYFC